MSNRKLDNQLSAIRELVAELDGPTNFTIQKKVDQTTGTPIVCAITATWEIPLDEINGGELTADIFTYGDVDVK